MLSHSCSLCDVANSRSATHIKPTTVTAWRSGVPVLQGRAYCTFHQRSGLSVQSAATSASFAVLQDQAEQTSTASTANLLALSGSSDSVLDQLYNIEGILGLGSYGRVWRGSRRSDGMSVAIKVLPKNRLTIRHQRTSVNREVMLWTKASKATSQAASFLAFHEDQESFIMVQELCRGGDLNSLITNREGLPESDARQIAYCVLTFLANMHKEGIYYGDMKPANIILKDEYSPCESSRCLNVRVVDFGCSQRVTPSTKLRGKAGTPLFWAPEVLDNAYGMPADMWAFGMTLFAMISNQLPLWAQSMSDIEASEESDVVRAIQFNPVMFYSPKWESASPELVDLLTRLLERDPSMRISAEQALQHPWLQPAHEMRADAEAAAAEEIPCLVTFT